MNQQTLHIFISAVSDEFGTYRKSLEKELKSSSVKVFEQDELEYDGTQILVQLKNIIKSYDVVFHLFGERTGKPHNHGIPDKEQLRIFLESEPTLLTTLGIDNSELAEISYTQWEAYLAIFYGKRLFVLTADSTAKRNSILPDDAIEAIEHQHQLQKKHRDRLERLGIKKGVRPETNRVFKGPTSLAKLALRKLVSCQLLPGNPSLTKNIRQALEMYVHNLENSTKGTLLPFVSREARDLNQFRFDGIRNWSIPRSIRRCNAKTSFPNKQKSISKDQLVRWCMEGKPTKLLIIGEAGTGKTSYLRQLTSAVCERWKWDTWRNNESKQQCRLPVFVKWIDILGLFKPQILEIVEGRAEIDSIESIIDALITSAMKRILKDTKEQEWICNEATEHGFVFFMDALDEAIARHLSNSRSSKSNSYEMAQVLELLGQLIERLALRNSVVISTTRSSVLAFYSPHKLDYLPTNNLSETEVASGIYELQEWDIEDARNYVSKTVGVTNPEKAEEINSGFKKHSSSYPGETDTMESLWKDPFLLSLFCNLKLESDVATHSTIANLTQLYNAAIAYLADTSKKKDYNYKNMTDATAEIISQYFLDTYLEQKNRLFDWSQTETDIDAALSRILRQKNNRNHLKQLGGEINAALVHLKSTGFFEITKDPEGIENTTYNITDYRIYEYMIASAVNRQSIRKKIAAMDRVFDIGSNPSIFYHIVSTSEKLTVLSWWIATRLSTLGYEIRKKQYDTDFGVTSFGTEAIEKKFIFSSVIIQHPRVIQMMQTLNVFWETKQDQQTFVGKVIKSAHAFLIVHSNRNFLRAVHSYASNSHFDFYRLRPQLSMKRTDDNKFVLRTIEKFHAPNFFASFVTVLLIANPRLFLGKLPHLINKFNSYPCGRFLGLNGLVRIRYEQIPKKPFRDYFIVTEEQYKYRQEVEPDIVKVGEELGFEDILALDAEFSKTLCGVLYHGLSFKFGSFVFLTERIALLPFDCPSFILKQSFGEFFSLLRFIYLQALLLVISAFLTQGLLLILYCLTRKSVFISSNSDLPGYFLFFFLTSGFVFLYLVSTSNIAKWLGGKKTLVPKFGLDYHTNSREASIESIDGILSAGGIKTLLYVYEKVLSSTKNKSFAGDYLLLRRSSISFQAESIFNVIESQNLADSHTFSDEALMVFFREFHKKVIVDNNSYFGANFLQQIFHSAQRSRAIEILSNVLDTPVSTLLSYLENPGGSIESDYADNSRVSVIRFIDSCRHASGAYFEEVYGSRLRSLPVMESAIESLIRGDFPSFHGFLKSYRGNQDMPIELWVDRHVSDGSIFRIVSCIAEGFYSFYRDDFRVKCCSYDIGYCVSFLNEIGGRYHTEEVCEFCSLLLSNGYGLRTSGSQSIGFLNLLRGLPDEVRARHVSGFLASVDSFSDFFSFFGFYDEQKLVIKRAITGRTLSEPIGFKRVFLRSFRKPIYVIFAAFAVLRFYFAEFKSRK
jgi:hypothetical protein